MTPKTPSGRLMLKGEISNHQQLRLSSYIDYQSGTRRLRIVRLRVSRRLLVPTDFSVVLSGTQGGRNSGPGCHGSRVPTRELSPETARGGQDRYVSVVEIVRKSSLHITSVTSGNPTYVFRDIRKVSTRYSDPRTLPHRPSP